MVYLLEMVIFWDLMGFNGISPRKIVIYWDLMGFTLW
jgi:hypothetical protein